MDDGRQEDQGSDEVKRFNQNPMDKFFRDISNLSVMIFCQGLRKIRAVAAGSGRRSHPRFDLAKRHEKHGQEDSGTALTFTREAWQGELHLSRFWAGASSHYFLREARLSIISKPYPFVSIRG